MCSTRRKETHTVLYTQTYCAPPDHLLHFSCKANTSSINKNDPGSGKTQNFIVLFWAISTVMKILFFRIRPYMCIKEYVWSLICCIDPAIRRRVWSPCLMPRISRNPTVPSSILRNIFSTRFRNDGIRKTDRKLQKNKLLYKNASPPLYKICQDLTEDPRWFEVEDRDPSPTYI